MVKHCEPHRADVGKANIKANIHSKGCYLGWLLRFGPCSNVIEAHTKLVGSMGILMQSQIFSILSKNHF